MPVTIETTAPCKRTLRIEVLAERVAGARAEILQQFRREANLPGFRPGKAPEPMVEKRYAKEIDDEVRKRLIPDAYREAIAENKLRVVGYPDIAGVTYTAKQALVFNAVVDTAPEFNVPEYKGIAVKRKENAVTEEDVTKTIDSLREQQADFVAVEGRAIALGDFGVMNYTAVVDGKPISELVPEAKTLGEHKDFWLLIQPDSFLPGFCDQLVGANVGDKREVTVKFQADFPQQPLAGKKATYSVEVTAIKERKLLEVTDEFAKRVGVEGVEKLKAEVRKSLTAERENEQKGEMRNQIVEHLNKQVQFELPESLVAAETRSIVYDLVRENSQRGITKEQLAEKKDEIYGYAAQSAKEHLKTSFILEAIAQKENITVSEDEMEERVQQLAIRYRTTPDKLKAQLDEKGGLGEIEEQILVGKTLDFLLSNATVENVNA